MTHPLRRLRYGRPVIVVSGLPRSGTSMMMQMLEAGGIAALTDGVRRADPSNPRGYYELERVKDLEGASLTDMSWLRDAKGRAVKIISYLLRGLPDTLNYKVIFMQRRLEEILVSQARMLESLGEADGGADFRMRRSLTDDLARARSLLTCRSCFEVLSVPYDAVIGNGVEQAQAVGRFLGLGLDAQAMAAVVRESLYRNRR